MVDNNIKLGSLRLRFPYFEDQIRPKGFLDPAKECHAAWYYFMLAYANHLQVGDGPESQVIVVDDGLQTPLWMDLRYHNIAKSVALIYGLESPDSFLPYVNIIDAEARRMHDVTHPGSSESFDMPPAIWRPFGIGVAIQ